MEREHGAKKGGRRRGQAKSCAGGKGEGCGFEGERFLKMWNRMYIYIRPSQDKKKVAEKKQQEEPQKKAQRKRRI